MSRFGPPSDDENTDEVAPGPGQRTVLNPSGPPGMMRAAPSGGEFDDEESTEIVNNAEIGGFFGGRFRIDARLGVGAMGRVLTALDTENGQLVALKVLHRERSRDKNVLRRFAREAAALRAINHRAIVGIVASGRAPDGTPWLAMEHLVGQTLKARIQKAPMQPAEFWPILKTLAEAVGEAHARGVVHRDLKPDNIFLPEGGDPPCKILDFGLSTLNREGADKVTATGQVLGTPRYMAPELLASIGKPDHRVDVFALAVVTFEALTGRSLYSADDLGSLFGQILEARTHSLRQFRPDLSPDLEAVIKQGHARSMSDRFQTAGAFATAFAMSAGIGESIRVAPALAGLFDDVNDGDGVAPLVDPFGAPSRSTGPVEIARNLPPLASEVPPLVPELENRNKSPSGPPKRSRVATAQGVAPAGFPLPSALLPPLGSPQARQPSQSAYPGSGDPRGAASQLGSQAGFGSAVLPQTAMPRGTPPQPAVRPPAATLITSEADDPANQVTLYSQQSGPAAWGPPSFGAAAQPGPARGFSIPSGEPRFTAPAAASGASAVFAPAPVAPASQGLFTSRRLLGCLLFSVAALVVVVIAVGGAIALRWWMARGGF